MIRLQDESHSTPFHFCIALNFTELPQFSLDLREQVPAQLSVGYFPPAELQGELHLVPLF